MIELKRDELKFSFPEVHRDAVLRVNLQRTMRIPDDGRDYPLPAGMGRFPMRHVDDCAERVPESWRRHGGVMLPMYQSEALWINFDSDYPFAVKVAAGKLDAVTGDDWSDGLHQDPQDYLVTPGQPWLDGFAVEKGIIRQFVAMPLGAGYSAEEQLTGAAEHGGLQIAAYPIRAEVWERMKASRVFLMEKAVFSDVSLACAAPDMGLAPGGRMKQEIYEDEHDFEDWDTDHRSRCFVHLTNAMVWRAITGEEPPPTPCTADEYHLRMIPWFDWYDADRKALEGSEKLSGLKSVWQIARKRRDKVILDNESVDPGEVVELGPSKRKGVVREGTF